tara:strand:+ start:61246 stop:61641 length:396 start_codon:yes stop_codon:yes gene_type:complete
MPNLKVVNSKLKKNESRTDIIQEAIDAARKDGFLSNNEMPPHVTLCFQTQSIKATSALARYGKNLETFMHIADKLAPIVIIFKAKKSAKQQLFLSCSSQYLRDNTENYSRSGKKIGSEQYNTLILKKRASI